MLHEDLSLIFLYLFLLAVIYIFEYQVLKWNMYENPIKTVPILYRGQGLGVKNHRENLRLYV